MLELITPREARRMLSVSRTTLLRWQAAGRITPHCLESGHRRYDRADVAALAAHGNRIDPPAPDLREVLTA